MSSLVISSITILVCLMHLAPPASTAPTAPVLPDIPESTTMEVQFFGQKECKGSEMLIKTSIQILPGTEKSESICHSTKQQLQCAKMGTPVKGYEVYITLFEKSDCRGNSRTELLPLNLESEITAEYFKVVAVATPNSPER